MTELNEYLSQVKKLDIGMAKKQRLHALVMTSYKKGIEINIKKLSNLSRVQIEREHKRLRALK